MKLSPASLANLFTPKYVIMWDKWKEARSLFLRHPATPQRLLPHKTTCCLQPKLCVNLLESVPPKLSYFDFEVIVKGYMIYI